jgi:hypothetical protein
MLKLKLHIECPTAQKPRLEVVRSGGAPVVPNVGDIVTAKVNKINSRLASLDILCVGDSPVQQRYSGIIRVRDVRATEIDKVRRAAVFACARPRALHRLWRARPCPGTANKGAGTHGRYLLGAFTSKGIISMKA